MERYYFKTTGGDIDIDCLEKCMVKNSNVMIGSCACQDCKHCLEYDATPFDCNWIICERIKEATTPIK